MSVQSLSLTHPACAGQNGWPTSTVVPGIPETDEDRAQLIDTLQDWKSAKYREIVCESSGHPCGLMFSCMMLALGV